MRITLKTGRRKFKRDKSGVEIRGKIILPFSPFSVKALSKSSSEDRGVSARDSSLLTLSLFDF